MERFFVGLTGFGLDSTNGALQQSLQSLIVGRQYTFSLNSFAVGKPCGELMRRYWQPVGLSAEVTHRPKDVRILGEDLILFRDKKGRPGLLYQSSAIVYWCVPRHRRIENEKEDCDPNRCVRKLVDHIERAVNLRRS